MKEVLKVLFTFCTLFSYMSCAPYLCKNGAKIDSITFVNHTKQWFFTSGGYYWFEKDKDFPPQSEGTPLPGGFKRGDAAIFINTMKACNEGDKAPKEMEVHVIEMTTDGNKIMKYDVREHKWAEPIPYNEDRGIGQAKVDWTKPIDATFVYKLTNFVVIQDKKYSVVDIKNRCSNPDAFGNGAPQQSITDLNVQTSVDATAGLGDDWFILFQDQVFWKIKIMDFREKKRFNTRKNLQQNLVKEFFNYTEDCKLPPKGATDAPPVRPLTSAQKPTQPAKDPKPPAEPEPTEAPPKPERTEFAQGDPDPTNEEENSSWIWIIVGIIAVVILIGLVIIACLLMRKKKPKESRKEPEVGAVGSRMGSQKSKVGSTMSGTGGSKVKSTMSGTGGSKMASKKSLGDSPSTMSVRSNAGVGSGLRKGGKVSAMGISPSTMSVRSKAT